MKTVTLYCLALVAIVAVMIADFSLIVRVKYYFIEIKNDPYSYLAEDGWINGYEGWISCEINPICNVTVPALTTDHVNFYIFTPAAILINDYFQLDKLQNCCLPECINVNNLISITHAFIGLLAGFFIASSKLKFRRAGVALFQFRTLLVNLDGVVARKIHGAYSSIEYYVDGVCEILSIIWLLISIYSLLVETEHILLPVFSRYSRKHTQKLKGELFLNVTVFASILFLSGAAWNRYLMLFEEKFVIYGLDFMRSAHFLANAWMWRVLNFNALLQYLVFAVFINKLREFIKTTRILFLCSLVYVCIVSETVVQYSFP